MKAINVVSFILRLIAAAGLISLNAAKPTFPTGLGGPAGVGLDGAALLAAGAAGPLLLAGPAGAGPALAASHFGVVPPFGTG